MSDSADAGLKKFRAWAAKNLPNGSAEIAASARKPLTVLPTGSQALDFALVTGGYARGFQHELYGPDGLGKTTLALLGIRSAQQAYPDRLPVFVDVEHKLHLPWAEALGVDLTRLVLVDPETAEDAANATRQALDNIHPSLLVVDSIGAFLPRREIERGAEDADVGTTPKVVTRMVKLCSWSAKEQGAAVLYINQVRAAIGGRGGYARPGGYALGHMCIARMRLSRTEKQPIEHKFGDDTERVGQELGVLVEKNGLGPGGRLAKFLLVTNPTEDYPVLGIDPVDELSRLGIKHNVIVKGGSWYTLPDDKQCQGQEQVAAYLRERPLVAEQVRTGLLGTVADQVVADPLAVQA